MGQEIPQWLKEMVGRNKAALRNAAAVKAQHNLDEQNLHTVCVAAQCPNRGECFNCGDATFMILGDICTRGCRFCAVTKQYPRLPDEGEPKRIAETVKKWAIRYAVLTSPTRDDLADGGARHFAQVITAIKTENSRVRVEPLIPDFKGNLANLYTVLDAKPEVLAHNIETVPSLYKEVRVGADYQRSLAVLKASKKYAPAIFTKSGIMVGLGETDEEIRQTLQDLRAHEVDLLTIGQYLAPSKAHYPVARYPQPQEYRQWEAYALSIGFKGVASGPLVRSSYRAGALYYKAACV